MSSLKKLFHFLIQPRQLYFCILFAIIVPNVALCFTEDYSVGAVVCNLLLPLSIYGFLFTLKRSPGIMIWLLFPFIFLSAFQLVLLYLFGNSIIAVDMFLNLVTTNASEALELLDNLVPAVFGVFVLYVPILIFAVFSIRRKGHLSVPLTRKIRCISGIGLLVSGALVGITSLVDNDFKVRVEVFPFNVCYNCYLAFERTEYVANYVETSKAFCFHASSSHEVDQPEIYLLVIGETGRACNWGLYGYERNTTPNLQQQAGLVHFTDVLTQSNTTHKSVPMLLSLASAENYDRIYREKSVITAFKEAGFYTAFYSNQKYNHAFIDLFGKEADESVFLKEEGTWGKNPSDVELLSLVDQLLSQQHRKLLIVLHTYGSHFNYRERYSSDIAAFKPDNISDASPKFRDNLVNAYDNSILQTDVLLNGLIERLKRQQALSAMIYTSDHGEDIFDDDRLLFLHSSPVPSYYQLHVPFVIWMSQLFRENFSQISENVVNNSQLPVSSNASVVPTLLQMGGLETPYRVDSLSLASDNYHIDCRYYIDDHNLPRTYDDIGLDEEDFALFRQMKLVYP